MSLPPGFTTRKISRVSPGKSGHQKCVSTAVTRSNVTSGNGNCDTEACRISTRPISIHRALVFLLTATLSSEKSMPHTFPCVAIAVNLPTVHPPPQPISRIVSRSPTDPCARPQSVSLEWLAFMRHNVKRPNHPLGFLHWLTCALLVATVMLLGRQLNPKSTAPRVKIIGL